MEWTQDVAVGDWLRERIDDPWRGTMHDAVPRGFAAYARVFHPAYRERPVGRAWPADGEDAGARAAWEAFTADAPEIDTERVRWAEVARAFGTTMHPTAQWGRLIGRTEPYGSGAGPRDTDGWRYDAPREGHLESTDLTALAQILQAHTTTPDAGGIAIWEGWGGLVGTMQVAPSGLFGGGTFGGGMPRRYAEYTPVDQTDGDAAADAPAGHDDAGSPDAVANRHRRFVSLSFRDFFNNPFQKPTWQPGVLSDEISRGPRFTLPNRDYVLFHGGIAEFADDHWAEHVPWQHASGWPDPASPSLVWPDDHAWVLVTEIDWDSTIVAGTADLVAALVADPRLDVAQIPADADLAWDGDEVNR